MPTPVDDDMRFGGQDFTQPDMSVPDDLLGMGGDEEQLEIDPRALGLETPEIAPAMTMPAESDDEVAGGVENTLLEMLQNGQHDAILVLAGERPATASLTVEPERALRMAYAKAVRANPALRWYAKLAALLPAERFGIREGSLQINMPAPMFRKAVAPFIADFRADWAEASPMAAVVRGMAASVRAADLSATQSHLARGLRAQSNVEASDFNPATADFGTAQVDDSLGAEPGPAAPPVAGPMVPQLPISLTDLSLKAVADHLATIDGDDDTLNTHLLDAGFSKARANEIMAMYRYRRLSQARRKALYAPQGNRGAGSVEFTFR